VVYSGDWCQSNEQVQFISPCIVGLGKRIVHLSGTLRVCNISHLGLGGKPPNIIDLGRSIVVSHFSPAELPVRLVFSWVKSVMAHAVLGSSLVAKPDIIALVHQLECWSKVGAVHDPAICWVGDTMHKEDSFCVIGCGIRLDPEDVKDVTIVGGDWVWREDKSIFFYNLLEGFVKVGVNT